MKYTPDQFLDLAAAVEEDGGAHLPDACLPQKFSLMIRDSSGKKRKREQFTAGCEQEVRFAIPYEPQEPVMLPDAKHLSNTVDLEDNDERNRRINDTVKRPPVSSPVVSDDDADAQRSRGASFATVCAIDDAVGMWPRFRGVVSDDE